MSLGFEHHRRAKEFGQYRSKIGSLYNTLTIGTSATPIRANGNDLEDRHTLRLANVSTNTVYIGFDDSVTTSNGFPIDQNEKITIEIDREDQLTIYGIAGTSSEIRLLEIK